MSRASTSFLSLIFLVCCVHASGPIVKTELGEVEGLAHRTRNGVETHAFLGIPFAKPPIGELRLEKPQPFGHFKNRLRAKKMSLSCQTHYDLDSFNPEGEDCLTLNIIKPAARSADPAGYPVAVWIHPGGYCVGGSSVVPVASVSGKYCFSWCYHGYSSTGDDILPGNIGSFDQALALKWVHDNIESFGGNSRNITAFGLSAGAASVSQLVLSPYSRDYISQAIQLSGSHYATWTTSEQSINSTLTLARQLHCDMSSSQSIKQCMKHVSVRELIDATHQTGMNRKSLNLALFSPRLDGDFFPKDYPHLIKEVQPKPTLFGSTKDEGIFFSIMNALPSINGLGLERDEMARFDAAELEHRIRHWLYTETEYGSRAQAIQDRVVDFYVKRDAAPADDALFYADRYTQLQTHTQFFVPLLMELEDKIDANWPLYLYQNVYHGAHHFHPEQKLRGTVHAAELKTAFDGPAWHDFELNDEDRKHREVLLEMMISFIKNGQPISKGLSFPRLNKTAPHVHVQLHTEPVLREAFDKEVVQFWEKMRKDFGDMAIRSVHYGEHEEGWKHSEL